MTTPEQQARDMLERMGFGQPGRRFSSGDLVELANLIAERDALKAEMQAIKRSGEPVGYVSNGHAGRIKRIGVVSLYRDQGNASDTPLYTRPAVPLTDERVIEIRDALLPSQGEPFDCVEFARAIEAHIKGAKP